jgi:hypothetical protein
MTRRIEGSFEVTSWSEEEAGGFEEPAMVAKVSTASIGQRFSGGIEADTVSDTVMTYHDDGTAEFVSYQRVVGRIGDKRGSFVLRGSGRYDGQEATTDLEVVPGSARGGLSGLAGRGVAVAPHGSTGTFRFDLDL